MRRLCNPQVSPGMMLAVLSFPKPHCRAGYWWTVRVKYELMAPGWLFLPSKNTGRNFPGNGSIIKAILNSRKPNRKMLSLQFSN